MEYLHLNTGRNLPMLGLGTYQTRTDDEMGKTVAAAWRAGYRLFDSAAIYQNEAAFGRAFRALGAPRHALFITTKVWSTAQREGQVESAVENSLREFGLDYVDLVLLHWPVRDKMLESWRALEYLYESGVARAIGVANFVEDDLKRLMGYAKVKPCLDQFECHPRLPQRDLVRFCQEQDIVPQAYCPIFRGGLGALPLLRELAARYGKTPAQIILRWHIQQGVAVIPKSSNLERVSENSEIFDFMLTKAELVAIDGLENGERLCDDPTVSIPY